MTNRLHVSRVAGNSFGRFTNRAIELGLNPFVVVHGPNESGKSTLTELLSWVLAGRRGVATDTLRYGYKGDVIGGSVSGRLGDDEFSISRTFTVRDSNQGKAPKEREPVILLGNTTIPLETWEQTISVRTGEEFALRYRITEAEDQIDLRALLESLAVGARVGVMPATIIDRLESGASILISPPNGHNRSTKVGEARARLEAARRDHKAATEATRSIFLEQKSVTDMQDRLEKLSEDLTRQNGRRASITTAIDLVEMRTRLDSARSHLQRIERVPDEWRSAVDHSIDFSLAIARLRDAEAGTRNARREYGRLLGELSISEETAHLVSLDPTAEGMVNRTIATRATAESERKSASLARVNAETNLSSAREQFNRLAQSAHMSADEAEALVGTPVDDLSFNDVLKRWIDAATEASDASREMDSATTWMDDSRVALDRAQRAWDKVGISVDPHFLHTGGSHDDGLRRSSGRHVALLAPRVLISAGMVIVVAAIANRWLGAVVAAVAMAALAIAARASLPHAATSPMVVGLGASEAADLVAARQEHSAASGALQTATRAHALAAGRLADAQTSAVELLRHLGVHDCDGPEHASLIRARRVELASELRSIQDAQSQLSEADNRIARAHDDVSRANDELAKISAACGIPSLGSFITPDDISRIKSLVAARTMLADADSTLRDAHRAIAEIAGHTELNDRSADEIQALFADISEINHLVTTTEGEIDTLTDRIEVATSGRAEVRSLLDDPTMTKETLEDLLRSVDDDILMLSGDIAEIREKIGATKSRILELESRADLPEINYRIEQAQSDLREATRDGAAARVAAKVVTRIKDDYERQRQPHLVRAAGEMVHRATRGTWKGLKVSDDGSRLEVMYGDSVVRTESAISSGSRDLLRLAVRIAVADAHGERSHVALPLIFDDPTSDIDSTRSPEVFDLLAECATRRQVILLTHDERTVDLAIAAGAAAIPMPHP